jgi:hypothetical protein
MIQLITKTLIIKGALNKKDIFMKLVSFGANGVIVFQGIKSDATMQIQEKYAPHMVGVHCITQHTNLVVQTLNEYF